MTQSSSDHHHEHSHGGHGNGHDNHGNGHGNGHDSHGNGHGYGHDHCDDDHPVPCFVAGTRIATPEGDKAVENLKVGDVVLTLNGETKIKWIDSRSISDDLADKQKPVKISAGALGHNTPETDLFVSRQHRVLVDDADGNHMLIAAGKLAGKKDGFNVADLNYVTYVHFATNNHEVVLANGALAETLLVGAERQDELFSEYTVESLKSVFGDKAQTTAFPIAENFKPIRAIQRDTLITSETVEKTKTRFGMALTV